MAHMDSMRYEIKVFFISSRQQNKRWPVFYKNANRFDHFVRTDFGKKLALLVKSNRFFGLKQQIGLVSKVHIKR